MRRRIRVEVLAGPRKNRLVPDFFHGVGTELIFKMGRSTKPARLERLPKKKKKDSLFY